MPIATLLWACLALLASPFPSYGDEKVARPESSCPVASLVTRHYLSEFPELGSLPIISEPEKVVHPGDVLVQVLAPHQKQKPDAWGIMLGPSPHAMVVARIKGQLGNLNSPSVFGGDFISDFRERSYVILRPKFTAELAARFSTRELFEEQMNRYITGLHRAGIVYDPLMQTDLLTPGYAKSLREKVESNCLTNKELKPLYCSELPATVGAMIEIPIPQGQSLDQLFDSAIQFVKASSRPEELEKRLNQACDEIINIYVETFQDQIKDLENTQERRKNSSRSGKVSAKAAEELIKLEAQLLSLRQQVALFEASRAAVKEIVLVKAFPDRKATLSSAVKPLLQSRVIRPADYLLEAKKAGYELIGLYAHHIPPECFQPVSVIAGEQDQIHR